MVVRGDVEEDGEGTTQTACLPSLDAGHPLHRSLYLGAAATERAELVTKVRAPRDRARRRHDGGGAGGDRLSTHRNSLPSWPRRFDPGHPVHAFMQVRASIRRTQEALEGPLRPPMRPSKTPVFCSIGHELVTPPGGSIAQTPRIEGLLTGQVKEAASPAWSVPEQAGPAVPLEDPRSPGITDGTRTYTWISVATSTCCSTFRRSSA